MPTIDSPAWNSVILESIHTVFEGAGAAALTRYNLHSGTPLEQAALHAAAMKLRFDASGGGGETNCPSAQA
jgi:endonuclease/exonuclease/phosphatase (EEP) superfamily protein YafD